MVSNVNLVSNMTPILLIVSRIDFFLHHYSSTLILAFSLELTNRWHLSALLFKRLFLNYSNEAFDDFSKDVITPLILPTASYRVSSFA